MTDDLVKRLRRTYRKEYAPTRSMCGDNSNKPFPFPILATEVPVNPDGHEAADRIEALTAENERLLVSNEQWQVDYNEAVIDKLELETKIKRLRGIGLHLVQHINWVTNGLPDLLEDACLTDEEGVINAAIAAATEARAALEKQP